jgi:hypothetical protein
MKNIINAKSLIMKTKFPFVFRGLKVLLLICLFVNTSKATNYHVAPTGNDLANGSITAPIKTIAKAASMVVAGDTVFVDAGTYLEQNITPKSSGTESAMIVFKPSSGTGDVIIQHPGTLITDNTPVFQLSSKSFIWIEGFIFKDFMYGKACVYISSGVGNVIINNRFENLGNSEVGSWDGNQMVALFNSSKNVVCNNYFNNITGDGINVNSQSSTNNLVCYNTFIGFKGKLRSWGGTNLFSRAIDIQDMSTGNNIIAFNYAENVYHHIWLDRDGSNNFILRNVGRKGSGHVFNESRCANNVIQENISMEMKVGYMTAYYDNTGWTFDPRWINNVAYNNETGFLVHKSNRDEFRNNIVFNNTSSNLEFTAEAYSNGPHVFRNNLWYSVSKANSIKFQNNMVPVAEFQASVEETGGLSVNPLFTSIVSGAEDFTLQVGSPAKGAADNGLDLGAYAVYPKIQAGWNSNLQLSGVNVYFDQVLIKADRESTVQLLLKLSKASTVAISADIVPIAGDAVAGDDYALSSTTVTFQPGETSKTISIDLYGDKAPFDELVAFGIKNMINAVSGGRNLCLLKINKIPEIIAYASTDQAVWDNDKSGSEDVLLDGSGSNTPNGTIISYIWSENGTEIATGVSPTVSLLSCTHTIVLTVTDSEGNTDNDVVIVKVIENAGIWLEAECGVVGSLWSITTDANASNSKFVTIQSGNNSTTSAPTNADGLLTYIFNVTESGNYTLYLRVICPNSNDDSFWLKMDNGAFASWNGITASSSWLWVAYPTTYSLAAGTHTFTIGYREDGAKLDKLWITNSGSTPSDLGAAADNCGLSALTNSIASQVELYPNPVRDVLSISLPNSPVTITIFDINGRNLFNQEVNQTDLNISMAGYKKGIYLVKIISQNQSFVKRIIKD